MPKQWPLAPADEELASLAQDGDQSASTELDRRYRGKMIGILARIYTLPWADSEDIYQEAFYKCLMNFRPGGKSFKNFLFLVSRSVAIDYSRKFKGEGIRVSIDEASDGEMLDTLDTNIVEFGHQQNSATDNTGIELLNLLSTRAREVFHLRYKENKSWEEVARQLGYSSSDSARTAFKKALRLARLRLKPN